MWSIGLDGEEMETGIVERRVYVVDGGRRYSYGREGWMLRVMDRYTLESGDWGDGWMDGWMDRWYVLLCILGEEE